MGATSAIYLSAGGLMVGLPALAVLLAVASIFWRHDRRTSILLFSVAAALSPMLAARGEVTPVVGAIAMAALTWGRPEGNSLIAKAPPKVWLFGAIVTVAVLAFTLWWHQTFIVVQAGSFAWSRPGLPNVGLPLIICILVLGAAFNAVFEETLWRAVFVDLQGKRATANTAWLVMVSAGFGLSHLHGTPGGWIGVAATFCFGMAMTSMRRLAGGSIVVCVVTHLVADLILLWGLYG